ncbi:MAG TPA: hypothetical protein VMJ52_13335 [Xanthobacteraceae bacterium]|nr:hypothetical protein [Xanthobacteraceae bacterium]
MARRDFGDGLVDGQFFLGSLLPGFRRGSSNGAFEPARRHGSARQPRRACVAICRRALADNRLALSFVTASEVFDLARQLVETAMKFAEFLMGLRRGTLEVAFTRTLAFLLALAHLLARQLTLSSLLQLNLTLPLALPRLLALSLPFLLANPGDFAFAVSFIVAVPVARHFALSLEVSVAFARTMMRAFAMTPIRITAAFFAAVTLAVSRPVVVEAVIEIAVHRRLIVFVVFGPDDAVEPLTDRHAGFTCGFARSLACFGAKTSQVPGTARFHCRA